MRLNEHQIKEISEELQCGNLCYFHKLTGEIASFPDPNNPYVDVELFREEVDKVETDFLNYVEFKPMPSYQSYQVMEDFAEALPDKRFKGRLLQLLSERKPFSKFKWAVDNSDYRQDWFDFRDQAYFEWVKEQVEEHQR